MYLVEVLVRWTEVKVKKTDDNDEYVKRLIKGESDEEQNPYKNLVAYYDYSPMVIDLYDIARFNRSNDPNFTTLRMKDEEGYVIRYPYVEFCELYSQALGRQIFSLVPEDFEKVAVASSLTTSIDDETTTGKDGDDFDVDGI